MKAGIGETTQQPKPQLGNGLTPNGPGPTPAPRQVPANMLQQSSGPMLRLGLLICALLGVFTGLFLFAAVRGDFAAFLGVLFGGPMLVAIGNSLIRKPLRAHKIRQQLFRDGLVAAATIENITALSKEHVSYSGNAKSYSRDSRWMHEVTWTFFVGDAQFHGSAEVPSLNAERLSIGSPAWVLVDPNDFTQSMEWPAGFASATHQAGTALHPRIDASSSEPAGAVPPGPGERPEVATDPGLEKVGLIGKFMCGFGILFVILNILAGDFGNLIPTFFFVLGPGAAALYFLKAHTANRQRVYDQGSPTTAVVQDVRRGHLRDYIVTWSYVYGGATFEGTAGATLAVGDTMEPGDNLWVLVDSQDPTKSVEWPAGFGSDDPSVGK